MVFVLKLFPEKLRPFVVICGGFLIHLTLGAVYTMGNIAPYVASYLRITDGESDVTYSKMAWFTGLSVFGQGSTLFVGGYLERRFGPRIATCIGCVLTLISTVLSYWTVQLSYVATLFSAALLFGVGVGIAYNPPIVCAIKWLPHRKGLAAGSTVAGFGLGAFLFNQIQTAYVNPDNLQPNITIGDDKYFGHPDLLNRVPRLFLLLAGMYGAMQLLGLLVMELPPSDRLKSDRSISEANLVKKSVRNLTPIEMLKSPTFYLLWFMFLLIAQSVVFISVFYKSYGLTFIHDDHFLSLTGSFAAVCNFGGRIMWGQIGDMFGFHKSIAGVTSFLTFFVLLLAVAQNFGRAFYFVGVCGIFLSFSGAYALFVMAIVKSFGPDYMGVNYGLLFLSQSLGGITSATLSSTLLNILNYDGMCYLMAGLAYSSFILNLFLPYTAHGRIPKLSTDSERSRTPDDYGGEVSEE